MAENRPSSSKKRRDLDEHPQHMQFFKYSKMKYLSMDAIAVLQSYCYGPNREVCDFMYLLMRYYHRQMEMDNDYRAQLLQAGIEEIKPTAVSSDKSKAEAVDAPHGSRKSEEEEIQFLLEQKRVLEQELREAETDGGVDEVETDDEQEATPAKEAAQHETPASAATADPTTFPYNSPVPFDPLQSPRIVVKQEPVDYTEDVPAPVAPVPPTTIPSIPPQIPKLAKSEPFFNLRAETDCSQSMIANADEPHTTTPSMIHRKREDSKHQPASPKPQTIPARISQQPALAIKNPPSPQVPKAGTNTGKQRAAPTSASQQQPSVARHPAAPAVPKQAPQVEGHSLPVKSEAAPAPARAPEDPIKVAILSDNLMKLNHQIQCINSVRNLALKRELPSEIFYVAADEIGDPSPNFKLRTFKEMIKYAAKQAEDTDSALAMFSQPAIAHLKSTLSNVRTEIEGIWNGACAAIQKHQVETAAQQQIKQLQKQQARAVRQQHHTQANRPKQKRPHQDPQAQHQPSPKKIREPLQDTPDATPNTSAAGDNWVPVPSIDKSSPALVPVVRRIGVCAFCDNIHDPIKCPVYATPSQRAARKKELNLCSHCLCHFGRYHLSKCPNKNRKCSHCDNHYGHAALCRKLGKPVRTSPWAGNREIQRAAYFEANGAQFSPLATPVYDNEEVVRTTEPIQQSPA